MGMKSKQDIVEDVKQHCRNRITVLAEEYRQDGHIGDENDIDYLIMMLGLARRAHRGVDRSRSLNTLKKATKNFLIEGFVDDMIELETKRHAIR